MLSRRIALLFVLVLAAAAQSSSPYYKPGWNLFSHDQDVAIGKQAADQQLKKLPILKDAAAGRYLTNLGDRLAAHMPGPKFPYNFHLVAQKDINAFALPGGPIFVNTGAVCAAKDEAQLAGVVAHEESHVALRHSTSMASKKQIVSVPLGILGGIFNSGAGKIANLAGQMVVGGVFLKYSRDMESQADALGAQVMNAAGYDPRQMAQFFETLEAKGGSSTVQFLSDHPNPGNRRAAIEAEIPTLGPHPPYRNNSAAFDQIHARLCRGDVPSPAGLAGAPAAAGAQPAPAAGPVKFLNYQLTPPAGWSVYGDQTSQLTLAPANGLSGSGDQTQVIRGVIVSTFAGNRDALIADLQRANPQLRPIAGSASAVNLPNVRGQAIALTNVTAAGAAELDRLVTIPAENNTLLYFISIAPRNEDTEYQVILNQILRSLRRSQ